MLIRCSRISFTPAKTGSRRLSGTRASSGIEFDDDDESREEDAVEVVEAMETVDEGEERGDDIEDDDHARELIGAGLSVPPLGGGGAEVVCALVRLV